MLAVLNVNKILLNVHHVQVQNIYMNKNAMIHVHKELIYYLINKNAANVILIANHVNIIIILEMLIVPVVLAVIICKKQPVLINVQVDII